MTAIVLVVLATSCLWLSSLAASTMFFGALWRLRWSASLLLAYPLWWYSQLLITRGLSLFDGINQRSLIIATFVLFAFPVTLTIVFKWRNHSAKSGNRNRQPPGQGDALKPQVAHRVREVMRSYWLEVIAIVYIGFVSVQAALLYAPQIWDTYVYHLPMIANWLQRGSLSPWPTACLRQVSRAGGAEYQQLWVIGMPHVDLLVELPSILAGVIAGVFVGEVALRWGASRTVALSAGLSIFAIPQIFWAALSCKDDLIMTAGLLCALYNAIASFSEPRRTLSSIHGGAAAVAAALVCATKVPGLVFGGSFIVLFALFLLRMRLWNRFWIVTAVFVPTSLPAYAIQYIHNLQQYGGLFAESFVTKATWPGRWVPPAFESAFVSSIYYFLKLLFFEPSRGVGPRHDQSNYGIWFSLVVLPLAAVTNWGSILAMLRGKLEWGPKAISKERLFVAAYMLFTMAAVLSRHRFTTWDQRFTIWVCPLLLVLGMHAATKYISPVFFRILCVGFTLMTVRAVLAVGFLGAAKTSLFGTIELQPSPSYLRGYEAIYDARPGDTVLYLGGENTAEYPCWGWKYDRTVWVADTKASLAKYFERLPDWIVLEEVAREDLRLATLEFLAAQHYRRVSQDVSSQLDLPMNQRRTIWRK